MLRQYNDKFIMYSDSLQSVSYTHLTPEEEIEYKVFAAREIDVNEDLDVYTIAFASEEDYASYLKNSIEKALYSLKTKPDSEEDILTLSTCTSSSEAGRFIVQATQIQRTAK